MRVIVHNIEITDHDIEITDHNIEMQQAKALNKYINSITQLAAKTLRFGANYLIQTAWRPRIGRVTLSGNIALAVGSPYLM